MTDIVERLQSLHVWPQFVADEHADVILPRQSKGLYDVGNVATEAADTIATLRKQLENAREALDEAVKICEEELVPIYEDSPNETDSMCNELVRHIANNIRALKGQPDNKPSGIPVDSPTSIQHDKSGYTP